MDIFDNHEKTPYETEPVESPLEAMRAFALAFGRLLDALPLECDGFAEELKLAMYKPVYLAFDPDAPPISLYEIGVTHSPHKSVAGQYAIQAGKLSDAIQHRPEAVRALLIQEESGVLPRLCAILEAFRDAEREEDLQMDVFTALMRFLNECRRLSVMWE